MQTALRAYCNPRRARVLLVVSLSLISARADDWPQWRGPNRDGISRETGWRADWPAEGPKKIWEADIGVGFSSMSVANGRLFTMGNVNETDVIWCFDAETGKLLWKHEYPCSSKDPNGYPGPRCTPTVDGDRVYSVSRHGHFFCLDARNGKVLWSKEFPRDFGGVAPKWGFAGSPLIEKDWVLCEVNATNGTSLVAFNKLNGQVVWKNGRERAGYSSLVALDLEGQRCLAHFCADQFVLRRMSDGSELWRIPWPTSYGVNAATPILGGDKLFLSSGYGFGCALFQISLKGPNELWRNKNMRNHVNSCVRLDQRLYGFDEGELRALDWNSGEVKWSTRDYGKGSLIAADGKLILYGQRGQLGLAAVNPDSYTPLAQFQALGGRDTWAPPVLANGRIYVRSLDKLAAFDVRPAKLSALSRPPRR